MEISKRTFLRQAACAAALARISPLALASSGPGVRGGLRVAASLAELAGVQIKRTWPLRSGELRAAGGLISAQIEERPLDQAGDVCEYRCRLSVREGALAPTMLSWAIDFPAWSRDCYVVFPGAAYAGNRFAVRALPYPPRLPPEDARPDAPIIISDVPRLEFGSGPSAIALRTGDQSQPLAAVWDSSHGRAWLFVAAPHTEAGESGWYLSESADRTAARLCLNSPGVRPWRYQATGGLAVARSASFDRGAALSAGDTVTLDLRVEAFACGSIETLYARLFARRHGLGPTPQPYFGGDLAAAARAVEAKQLRENWSPALGLFLTQISPGSPAPYQAGWCGGMPAAWALLRGSQPASRSRAIRHFVRALTQGMAPAGLFFGKRSADGRWIADFILDKQHPWVGTWTLTRRQADALYAGLRMATALEQAKDCPPEFAACDAALLRCADRLATGWKTDRQFGQYLDQFSGAVVVGNSTSGALMPGALALAARRYRRRDLLLAAEACGESLYSDWTRRGVTCGGPGDALQCPDSESAFALVESFVVLAQITRSDRWWQRATAAGLQAASWVISYDYGFPADSEFGRLGQRTLGAVFANAQNKHGAPGICMLSATALATISAAGGEPGLARVAAEITGALPQFVSTGERPIHSREGRVLPPGWINERVSTSDWENAIGDVIYESCWPEISLLWSAADRTGGGPLQGKRGS